MRHPCMWLLLATVGMIVFITVVVGTINPTATADRNVPGATTGKGKSKLTD
jgi:hypothetical protein